MNFYNLTDGDGNHYGVAAPSMPKAIEMWHESGEVDEPEVVTLVSTDIAIDAEALASQDKIPLFERSDTPGQLEEMTKGAMHFGTYRKVVPIKAARVDGPFVVTTSEGMLRCEDGWLCFDSRGYPYPVADAEFQQIYQEIMSTSVQSTDPTMGALDPPAV